MARFDEAWMNMFEKKLNYTSIIYKQWNTNRNIVKKLLNYAETKKLTNETNLQLQQIYNDIYKNYKSTLKDFNKDFNKLLDAGNTLQQKDKNKFRSLAVLIDNQLKEIGEKLTSEQKKEIKLFSNLSEGKEAMRQYIKNTKEENGIKTVVQNGSNIKSVFTEMFGIILAAQINKENLELLKQIKWEGSKNTKQRVREVDLEYIFEEAPKEELKNYDYYSPLLNISDDLDRQKKIDIYFPQFGGVSIKATKDNSVDLQGGNLANYFFTSINGTPFFNNDFTVAYAKMHYNYVKPDLIFINNILKQGLFIIGLTGIGNTISINSSSQVANLLVFQPSKNEEQPPQIKIININEILNYNNFYNSNVTLGIKDFDLWKQKPKFGLRAYLYRRFFDISVSIKLNINNLGTQFLTQ